jgi:chemotaxis signal transduction protein
MTTQGEELTPVLPVLVDDRRFLVTARAVIEVIAGAPWTAIPGAMDEAPGVAFWKGAPLAIVDLVALTGDLPVLSPAAPRKRLLVVETGAGIVGVPADDAREVVLARTRTDSTGSSLEVVDIGARVGAIHPDDATFVDVAGLVDRLSELAARDPAATADADRVRPSAMTPDAVSTFLVVARGCTHWAIPAFQVERMVPDADAPLGPASDDLLDLLRTAAPDDDSTASPVAPKVLIVAGSARFAMRVSGQIAFRQVRHSDIRAVPRVLRTSRVRRTISGLVEAEGHRTLVVLDLAGLAS